MRYVLLILLLISYPVHADQKAAHDEGKAFAKEQLGKKKSAIKKAKDVPGFQTDRPAEAGMTESQLVARKATALDQNEHAAFVAKTVNERPFIKIDPLHDPTIQHAQEAAANPEATIAQVEAFEAEDDQPTHHTCEESRDNANYVCSQTRIIDTDSPSVLKHLVSLEIKAWRWRGDLGRNVVTNAKLDQSAPHPKGRHEVYTKLINPLPPGVDRVMLIRLLKPDNRVRVSNTGDVWISIRGKTRRINLHTTLQLEITYRPKLTDQQVKEHIENNCGPLKERAEKNLCRLVKEEITEGPEARELSGHKIHRPWWKKEYTYQCHMPSHNTCEPYRHKGCDLVGTSCKTKMGDTCVVSEQTYLCRKKAKVCRRISEQSAPFCVDGNCSDPKTETNKDMMEAISRLSVLKDIQGEVTDHNLHVFKGDKKSCDDYVTGVKKCCSNKGWGKSLGLTGCSGDDEILAQTRSKHLCKQIGKPYCSKRELGICIRETTSFCCFPTRMARVFHEQGRAQLRMGWGDRKNPDCRGFTVDELARIDFSKLDLQEVYADLQKTMKKPDLNKLNKSIHNRVETMVIDTDKGKGVKVG